MTLILGYFLIFCLTFVILYILSERTHVTYTETDVVKVFAFAFVWPVVIIVTLLLYVSNCVIQFIGK